METYDYIIAGSGLSGLTLAYNIINSPLKDKSILIIDNNRESLCNKTISFWSNKPNIYDKIVYKKWNNVRFVSPNIDLTLDLKNYTYNTLIGADIYKYVWNSLNKFSNIKFVDDKVLNIKQDIKYGIVECKKVNYKAEYVFDSTLKFSDGLFQSFIGWEIQTENVKSEIKFPIFMDIGNKKNDFVFFYLLPYSQNRFFVEIVSFEKPNKEYLKNYIKDNLKIDGYKVVKEEIGSTLLSRQQYFYNKNGHVIPIGINAGMVKSTTGYAFTRIEKNSKFIVDSLINRRRFQQKDTNFLLGLCDDVMLEIFLKYKLQINNIFTSMFTKNKIENLFKFLDEESNLSEICKICYSVCNILLIKISILNILQRLKNLARIP